MDVNFASLCFIILAYKKKMYKNYLPHGMMWINKITHMKDLSQCLVHEPSINVHCYE